MNAYQKKVEPSLQQQLETMQPDSRVEILIYPVRWGPEFRAALLALGEQGAIEQFRLMELAGCAAAVAFADRISAIVEREEVRKVRANRRFTTDEEVARPD